jgi:hypothetical protein
MFYDQQRFLPPSATKHNLYFDTGTRISAVHLLVSALPVTITDMRD